MHWLPREVVQSLSLEVFMKRVLRYMVYWAWGGWAGNWTRWSLRSFPTLHWISSLSEPTCTHCSWSATSRADSFTTSNSNYSWHFRQCESWKHKVCLCLPLTITYVVSQMPYFHKKAGTKTWPTDFAATQHRTWICSSPWATYVCMSWHSLTTQKGCETIT